LLPSLLVGALLGPLLTAVASFTGLIVSEYSANPRDEALLAMFGFGLPYGSAAGLAFGLLANWARRRK